MSARVRSVVGPLMVVLLTVAAIYGGNKLLFPPGGGYIVNAEFKDAAGLTKNSNIKIGGVAGGTVKDLKLTDHDTAMVKMELDKGAFPIGVGAKAASRPVNLLGEKYVDLDPGDLSRPLKSGSFIPISRTSRPVELDDVLNTLQPDVRARLRIFINEAGIALTGRGTDLNKTIDELPSALDQTTELVSSFSKENGVLGDLIERSDRVLASFSSKRGDLQNLVSSAADTLQVTADKRKQLADTVRAAPGALKQLRGTMTQLADTSTRLEPFAAQIRRTAPPLTQTLKELPGFATDAKPALASLRSTAPSLTKLGTDARAPIQRLRPTADQLADFTSNVRPIVESFDHHAFKNLLRLMNGWAGTIAKSDGLGHLFGLRIMIDKVTLQTVIDRYVTPNLPTAAKQGKPAAPAPVTPPAPKADAAPAPAPAAPKLPQVKLPTTGIAPLDQALQDVGGVIGGLLPKAGRTTSSAGSDVGALFDYLVGP